MKVIDFLSSPMWIRLTLTLAHFLWQGLSIALVGLLLASLLGRSSPRICYGIYLFSLFSMFLSVAVTYMLVELPATSMSHESEFEIESFPIDVQPENVMLSTDLASTSVSSELHTPEHPLALYDTLRPASLTKFRLSLDWEHYIPYIVIAYCIGVLVMLGRLLIGLWAGQRLRKLSEPVNDDLILAALTHQTQKLGLSLTPAIAFCKRVITPTVAGILKPMILLPFSFASGMSPRQAEMLIAHELAHIRRYDPLINVIQRVIEALLFFHPAVWFISGRIRIERENCCDDLVVQSGAVATEYAASLVYAAEKAFMSASRSLQITEGFSVIGRDSLLRRRVLRIIGSTQSEHIRLRSTWVVPVIFAIILGLGVLGKLTLGGNISPQKTGSEAPALTDQDSVTSIPTNPVQTVLPVGTSESEAYSTIQEAIDAAPEGAVIKIAPGKYEERLRIDKALTLEGAGWDRTTIMTKNTAATIFELAEAEYKEALRVTRKRITARIVSEDETKKIVAGLETEFRAELKKKLESQITLLVSDTESVKIRGLKLTSPGRISDGRPIPAPILKFSNAKVQVSGCVVVGSPGDGIQVVDGSDAEIRGCLIAAVWGTGIVVDGRENNIANARILDCDVRNCYHRGITIGTGCDATIVSRCRISGSAWHGIRYDNASPTIVGNLLFGNARYGIYALGKTAATVKQNLFYSNEMSGIGNYLQNQDIIENNTFVGNKLSGLEVRGASKPILRRNIFFSNPNGILCGNIIDSDSYFVKSDGIVTLKENLFWKNEYNFVLRKAETSSQTGIIQEISLDEGTHSIETDPLFASAEGRNFSLISDSPARISGIGAAKPIRFDSPWPLQPEELAVIPEGDTRYWQHWKKRDAWSENYTTAFSALYDELGRNYPCFELKGIDWKRVGRDMLPRAKDVKTDMEFGLLCMELVACLEDSHAYLMEGAAKVPNVPFPQWDPGLTCLIDDRGKPVVYYVDKGGPAEGAGVKVGMTVLSINGEPADEYLNRFMKQIKKYSGYSSERYLRYHTAQWLCRQMEKGAIIGLEMQDTAGQIHTFKLPAMLGVRYLPRRPVQIPGTSDTADVSWKRLKDNVGYIYVRRIRGDLIERLDQAVGELKDARGLIIDVRGNSGGGFDYLRSHRNFAPDDKEEPNRPRFAGPIALLIDSRCISAGEGWASWFVATKRAWLFGEATAGASAKKMVYTLTNGLFKVRYSVKAYRGYLRRPIERRGLEPDVPIKQNALDLALGRDTVLEAAKKHLLEQTISSPEDDFPTIDGVDATTLPK